MIIFEKRYKNNNWPMFHIYVPRHHRSRIWRSPSRTHACSTRRVAGNGKSKRNARTCGRKKTSQTKRLAKDSLPYCAPALSHSLPPSLLPSQTLPLKPAAAAAAAPSPGLH